MGISFEEINPGDSIIMRKDITAEMIDAYAAFTGDFNPVHMDEAFCLKHGFKSRIAHGMLVLSFVSTLIGMYLPGEGSVWLSQNMDFISPVYAGDSVTIAGSVTEKVQGTALSLNMIKMKILIKNQSGRIVARGNAKVSLK
ncbi:MAG: MaoC family dehydratase [Ruminiclostridium sp.]|nr:MaoC family dehydratase [Ruminiclostridium sp.]